MMTRRGHHQLRGGLRRLLQEHNRGRMGEAEGTRPSREAAPRERQKRVPNAALETTRTKEQEKSRKSAKVIDLLSSGVSIGTVERAKAALSAAQAQSAVTSPIEIGRAKKVSDEGLSTTTKESAKIDSKV